MAIKYYQLSKSMHIEANLWPTLLPIPPPQMFSEYFPISIYKSPYTYQIISLPTQLTITIISFSILYFIWILIP